MKFSPGTGAGCRPPADELYGPQRDAPEPPTAPAAGKGRREGRKEERREGRKVLGNDAAVTEDSGCSGVMLNCFRTRAGFSDKRRVVISKITNICR